MVVIYGYIFGFYVDFGNLVVFYFKKGDIIKVKVRFGIDVKLYGDFDEYYMMFCGVFFLFIVYGFGSGVFFD